MLDLTQVMQGIPERRDQIVDDLARAVATADRIGDPVLRGRIRYTMMWGQYQRADVLGADALLTEIEVLTEAVGLPHQRFQLSLIAGGRLLLAGRVDEAEAANERTLALGTTAGSPEALGAFGAMLYLIRFHQGRIDEIADFFIDVARDNPSIAVLRASVLFMLSELGRIDEARGRLAAEVANGFDFPYDDTWLSSMANLIDAAATTGDSAAASVLIERVAPFASHVISPSSVLVRGAVARPLARAATLLGDYDQAEAWFAIADDLHARLRAPFWTRSANSITQTLFSARDRGRSRPRPRPRNVGRG